MRASRWRILCLCLVNLYIAVHATLWYWLEIRPWGKTAMSGIPLLVIGRINASSLMILTLFASILLFGRAFCGWACHLRSLVEAGDWCLRRLELGERKLKCSRHPWIFRGVALYVVLLPAGLYLVTKGFHMEFSLHEPAPLSDLPGTGTTFFHKTAPLNWAVGRARAAEVLGSMLAVAAILFSMTIFLSYHYGPGAFCRLLCPYAALLGAAAKLSPWQRRITRTGQCTGCRQCSEACPQGIDVNREILFRRGKVTSAECIKCMVCIEACTHSVLTDSFKPAVPQTRPLPVWQGRPGPVASQQKPDGLPLWAEVACLLLTNLSGAALSLFGAFFYFAGSAIGFVVSRSLFHRLRSGSRDTHVPR